MEAASRFPLFSPACAVALLAGVTACLLLPELPPRLMLLGAALAGAGLALRSRWGRLLGVLLLGVAFAGISASAVLQSQLPLALQNKSQRVHGVISSLPVHEPRRTRFDFVVDDAPSELAELRGQTLRLSWYENAPQPRARLKAGSRWSLQVRLRAPRGLRNPGGSDAEKFAFAARIAAVGAVLKPQQSVLLEEPRGLNAWREGMSEHIAERVPRASSRYVRALALGDTRFLDQHDWTRLRAAGLTHLIAISGSHVGLVAGFCALFLASAWWLWPSLCLVLPRPFAAGAGALLGGFGYAALTGMEVPTLRTAVMIAALVLARAARRYQRMEDLLAVACIVLLLMDPLAILGAGFWLSFAGVAWLLWCQPDVAGKSLKHMAGGLMATQAVATLGLLPLTVLLFGQASAVGPVANLLAVPWWSLVVVPLSLLGVLGEALLPGLGTPCLQLAAWCFDLTWPLLSWLADSSLALLWLPEAPWYALPLAVLGAFWLLLPLGAPGRALALLLWLPLLYPARGLPKQGEVELVVLDVGQGLSVLVRTARHSLLYDMGPAVPDGYDAGERSVVPALHALGVTRLDAGVVSHGDMDHAGGRASVAVAFPMPRVFAPEGSPSPGTDTCEAGKRWEWDGVMFEFLHPNAGFPYLGNEASCVLRVETRHGSALLPGDAGHYVERKLLNEAPAALRSDVVVVGHHGSLGSSSAEFVTAVGARLALVSSGADNRFKHPRPQVVQRWCASGAEVVDTQRSGALRVWIGENGLQLREQRVFQTRLWDAIRRLGRASGLCYAPEISRL